MYDNDETLVGLFVGEKAKGYGKLRSYAPNESIIAEGDPVDHLVIVTSGTVAVLRRASDGVKKEYFTGSSIMGEQSSTIIGAAFFMLRRPADRAYVAMTDCMVARVDSSKVNDMYNDHQSVCIVRDLVRNSEGLLKRSIAKRLKVLHEREPVEGTDPEKEEEFLRIPRGRPQKMTELYGRIFRKRAAAVIRIILETRKRAGEGQVDTTLVAEPVHRAPPPAPGAPGRAEWLASRRR